MSTVGQAYGILPQRLAREVYPAWLVSEMGRLQREDFDEMVQAIQATEIGVTRALGRAFGTKVEDLPSWDDLESDEVEEDPEWLKRYREANKLPAVD